MSNGLRRAWLARAFGAWKWLAVGSSVDGIKIAFSEIAWTSGPAVKHDEQTQCYAMTLLGIRRTFRSYQMTSTCTARMVARCLFVSRSRNVDLHEVWASHGR